MQKNVNILASNHRNGVEHRLHLVDVVGGVPLAGEADLAPHRPGAFNLVMGAETHQAVVAGLRKVLLRCGTS